MLHNLEGQDCKEIKLNDQNKKRIIIYMNNVLHNAIQSAYIVIDINDDDIMYLKVQIKF